MRIKLALNRTTKQRMLPMDYQYYISAWIYKVLYKADKDFAGFLHEKGYGANETKLYKLFCFSLMNFGKPKLWKEQKLFEITANEIELKLSFDVPEIASNFVKGLFMEQEFFLGSKFNGIDFKVVRVETLPEPVFAETMYYTLQTPWVVSYRLEGHKNAQYLTPEHEMYNMLSVKHICEKYTNTRNTAIGADELTLTISDNYKRSGFRLKPDTKEETRVVGNLFDFELTAPVEIHKMIWNAGISEKSSSGFGWVELKPNSVDSNTE